MLEYELKENIGYNEEIGQIVPLKFVVSSK